MRGENDTLVLFTTSYPYSMVRESFLDPEIPHLASAFKNVIVVPRYCPEEVELTERKLPSNVRVDGSYLGKFGMTKVELRSILRCIFSIPMYKEIIDRPIALRLRSLKRLVGQTSEALQVCDWVTDFLEDNELDLSKTIFYTYWLDASTVGIGLAKKKYPEIKIVSRAHRNDLYEEFCTPPYLPFRELALSNLNSLFLISEDGRRYIKEHFPQFMEKCIVSRLGVPDPGFMTSSSKDDVFRIISCSYMVPVKRIDLLIRGLEEAGKSRRDKLFEWRHVGYGPLENSLKYLASEHLPPNVAYRFLGYLTKDEVSDQYRDPIDVFINVSESEGIPVSIMEAQSLGIPVIATAVGGTPEIVSDEVGLLLDSDPASQDIAEAFLTLMEHPELTTEKKARSRENWLHNYNSDLVHAKFSQMLRSL